MNFALKNFLVVVSGALLGGIANMACLTVGGILLPPPTGIDVNSTEGLASGMHLMQPKHFLFPFIAHAVGTFVGACVIARFAASRRLQLAMLVSTVFFAGGLWMVLILPSPMWFNALDLVLAYYPMGWLGYRLCGKRE
jgi:hypothetical protein